MKAFVGPSIFLSIVRRSKGLSAQYPSLSFPSPSASGPIRRSRLIPSTATSTIPPFNTDVSIHAGLVACDMAAKAPGDGSNRAATLAVWPLGLDPENCKVVGIRQQIRRRGYTASGNDAKTKAGLLKELRSLVRAESFAPPDSTPTGSSDGAPVAGGGGDGSGAGDGDVFQQRWSPDAGWVDRSTMERGPRGYLLCRFCKEETPSARRTFCSNGCVHEHRIRTQGSYVRKCLSIRDGGKCAECDIDAAELYQRAREAWTAGRSLADKRNAVARKMAGTPFEGKVPREGATRRPTKGAFWHADHIVPVVRGGGQCSLKNYQTLCVPCHAQATKRLAGERAAERATRAGKKVAVSSGEPSPKKSKRASGSIASIDLHANEFSLEMSGE